MRNRVASASRRDAAKCGKCGANLFPGDAATKAGKTGSRPPPRQKASAQKSRPSAKPPPRPAPSPEAEGSGISARTALGLIFGIGFVFLLIANTQTSQDRASARPSSPAPTERLPIPDDFFAGAQPSTGSGSSATSPPVARSVERTPSQPGLPPVRPRPPAGIYTNDSGRRLEAPFEIRTSPGADYYIKLVDITTQRDAVGIYVHGGRRLEVNVPLGSYEMRYASGDSWRGLKHLFGPGDMTTYSKSNDIFRFRIEGGYVNGYTVELIRQAGGNMRTYGISPDQF